MLRAGVALQAEVGATAAIEPDQIYPWGASQGGHAALVVDRYAPHYAPEFGMAGVIAAIPATDLIALAERGIAVASATTAGLAGAITALARWHGAEAALDQVLKPQIASLLIETMDTSCGVAPEVEGELDSVDDIYTADFISDVLAGDWEDWEPVACHLRESSLLTSPVEDESDAPILMILAEEDDLTWAPAARKDIEPLCDTGRQVELIECAGAGHVSGGRDSLFDQIAWLEARIAGEPLKLPCVVTEPVVCELPME